MKYYADPNPVTERYRRQMRARPEPHGVAWKAGRPTSSCRCGREFGSVAEVQDHAREERS